MHYVPYHKLTNLRNLVVDGRPNENTVLTLSHWPGSNTPEQYRDDLSVQIVFAYLADSLARVRWADVKVTSNNHFDEDGLVSLYSVIHPQEAEEIRDMLVDIARAGDFGTFQDRTAARVSFVLSAWANPFLSPLHQAVFAKPYPEVVAILYEELLGRLPKIIQKIENLVGYWKDEDDFLTATEGAIAKGQILLTDNKALSLCVVDVREPQFLSHKPKHAVSWISSLLHPMAIHNATDAVSVLVVCDGRYEFYYRYETWIDYVSRELPPRVDLSGLAQRLNALESSASGSRSSLEKEWQFNGVSEIIARLKLKEGLKSSIPRADFIELLTSELSKVPPRK
jgi:hypothetical protein